MPPLECPRWFVMWSLAAAIFAACKWLTFHHRRTVATSQFRRIGYLIAWPGLDADAFLNPAPLPTARRPGFGQWAFAIFKLCVGIALIWGAVPWVPQDLPIVRGWLGMAGLIFILHFGAFHILSCAWRAVGVDAKPLMNWPLLATGPSDFWSRRWNTAFRDLTFRFLFRPLAARLGPRGAIGAGFLFSGIVHDLVISVPAGGGYGLPTIYFGIQGAALLAERSKFGKRLGLGSGWTGRAFTAAVVIGPAFGLFHPTFIHAVVLPLFDALGAH